MLLGLLAVLPAARSAAASGEGPAPRLLRAPAGAEALHLPLAARVPSARSRSVRASAAPSLNYGGFAYVSILASDTERSLRFYRDVLGMEDQTSMRNAELPFPGAFVRAGTHQIRIMEYGNAGIPENPDHVGVPARAEDPLVGRPEHAGRDRHLALTIQDLAPLKQALVDAGVTYTMSKSGRAALFCRDPDGNGIEFMETPNLAESANESLRRFSEEMQNNPERAAEVERRIAEELRDINSGIDWGP